MNTDSRGPCPSCDALRVLNAISTDERDDARRERDETRRCLDQTLAALARVRAQLRDEERENAALRRRLWEGGR